MWLATEERTKFRQKLQQKESIGWSIPFILSIKAQRVAVVLVEWDPTKK